LTKGKNVYTSKIEVALDPRAKFTLEDRQAQFDLAMRLYRLCEKMAYEVDAINGVRDAARDRTSKIGNDANAKKQLQALSERIDAVRSKIVATKEGGAITGEERIREHVADVYGQVNNYEGRPTAMQVMRTEALEKELGDVWGEFQALTQKELAAANVSLKKKKLQPISVLSEADWQKESSASGGGAGSEEQEQRRGFFERD
jgi:hypothetical protein